MTPRGIHLPTRRAVMLSASLIFAYMASTLPGWALRGDGALPLSAIGLSLLVTAGLLMLIGVTIEALHRLEAAGWRFDDPLLSRWGVYYGAWLTVGLVIGFARLAMVQARSPVPLSAMQAAFVVFVCAYVAVAMMGLLEHQAMFVEAIARKQEASRKTVRFLFGAREAVAQAQDRRRHEALTFLERRLEPELTEMQARLALEESPEALEAIVLRLERLRDVEVREVSHLLHPSIIDMGLEPALRALARHRASDVPLRLELEGLSSQDLSARVSLQLYRIVELALDWVRPRAFRELRIGLRRLDDAMLRLEIVGRGAEGDADQAREFGASALLDARVAILKGTWGVEAPGAEELVFWVDVPDPAV